MASIMQGTTPSLIITINPDDFRRNAMTYSNESAAIDALIEYAKSEVIK